MGEKWGCTQNTDEQTFVDVTHYSCPVWMSEELSTPKPWLEAATNALNGPNGTAATTVAWISRRFVKIVVFITENLAL